jgi:hypothetical protein
VTRGLYKSERRSLAAARLNTMRDAEATAAGKPMPTDRLVDAAGKTLRTCQQRQAAEYETLRQPQRQLSHANAVCASHADWTADQDQIIEGATEDALRLLTELTGAVHALTAARSVREGFRCDGRTTGSAHDHLRTGPGRAH